MTNAEKQEVIRQRMADYNEGKLVAQRDRLVATWRAAYPEAANQPPSGSHRTLILAQKGKPDDANTPEVWFSDIYNVTVRRWSRDPVFNRPGGMIQIGINSLDGTARHDWREFQGIKNQIAGEECEAFELYPAESRLLDPSNYYTLWCFPGLKRIRVGHNGVREVRNADEALAPQRGFE